MRGVVRLNLAIGFFTSISPLTSPKIPSSQKLYRAHITAFQAIRPFCVCRHSDSNPLMRNTVRSADRGTEGILTMNKLLVLAAVGTTLITAAPASAQVYFGAGPNGFGVHIGPNAPDHNWRAGRRDNWRDRDFRSSYGSCETVRERTVTRSGRVVYTTHRICD
jgi:hypothetical protein